MRLRAARERPRVWPTNQRGENRCVHGEAAPCGRVAGGAESRAAVQRGHAAAPSRRAQKQEKENRERTWSVFKEGNSLHVDCRSPMWSPLDRAPRFPRIRLLTKRNASIALRAQRLYLHRALRKSSSRGERFFPTTRCSVLVATVSMGLPTLWLPESTGQPRSLSPWRSPSSFCPGIGFAPRSWSEIGGAGPRCFAGRDNSGLIAFLLISAEPPRVSLAPSAMAGCSCRPGLRSSPPRDSLLDRGFPRCALISR